MSKKRRALELAEWVRQVHDEWWDQNKQLKAQAGAWGHRWRRGLGGDADWDHHYHMRGPERGAPPGQEEEDPVSGYEQQQAWEWTPAEREFIDKDVARGDNNNKQKYNDNKQEGELPEIDALDVNHQNSGRGHGGLSKSEKRSQKADRDIYGSDKSPPGPLGDPAPLEAPLPGPTDGGRRRRSKVLLPNHGVDPVITDNNVPLPPYVHVNDLDVDVYKDADIPKRLPKELFKYDR